MRALRITPAAGWNVLRRIHRSFCFLAGAKQTVQLISFDWPLESGDCAPGGGQSTRPKNVKSMQADFCQHTYLPWKRQVECWTQPPGTLHTRKESRMSFS